MEWEADPGELKLMGEEPRFVYVKSCFLSHVVWYYKRGHAKHQRFRGALTMS
jgi:hypothetical protein